MPDKSIGLGCMIISVVIFAALLFTAVTAVVVGLFWLMMLFRGIRRCEECGKRFCRVEVKRDLTLEHKGMFEK